MPIPTFGNQINKWVPGIADANATVEYDTLTTEIHNNSDGAIETNWSASGSNAYACTSSGPITIADDAWHAAKIDPLNTIEGITSADVLFFGFMSTSYPPYPAILGRITLDGDNFQFSVGNETTTTTPINIPDVLSDTLTVACRVTAISPSITVDVRGFINDQEVAKIECTIDSLPDRMGFSFESDVEIIATFNDNNSDPLLVPGGDSPNIHSNSLPVNGWFRVSTDTDLIMPDNETVISNEMLVAFKDKELLTYIASGTPLNPFSQVVAVSTTPYAVTNAHCGKILTLEAGSSVLDFDDAIDAGFSCISVNKEAEAKTLQSTGGTVSNPDSDTKVAAKANAMVTVVSTATGTFSFQGATEA